jgi:hypothetical protein
MTSRKGGFVAACTISVCALAACALAACALSAGLLSACGRKADPRPPEFVIPRSAEPVEATNVIDGIQLRWRRPRTYVDGTTLEDLGSFVILRTCGSELEFREIGTIPVTDRERFRKTRAFNLVDHDVAIGSICRYRVVAMTLDEYRSAPAESEWIERRLPEPTPSPTVPGGSP